MKRRTVKLRELLDDPKALSAFLQKQGRSEASMARVAGIIEGPHPDPELIYGFARGEISQEDADKWLEHIAVCPQCAEEIYVAHAGDRELWGTRVQSMEDRDLRWPGILRELSSEIRLKMSFFVDRATQITIPTPVPVFENANSWIPYSESYSLLTSELIQTDEIQPSEQVALNIEIPADGYLTAFMYSHEGAPALIFPRGPRDRTVVSAGKTKQVRFIAPDSPGKYFVQAIWSGYDCLDPEEVNFGDIQFDAAINALAEDLSELDKSDRAVHTVPLHVVPSTISKPSPFPKNVRVYLIRAVDPQKPTDIEYWAPILFEELRRGRARFGWSDESLFDLEKGFLASTLNRVQMDCWDHSKFLLDVNPGDFLIYVNVPTRHQCAIVEVTGLYKFTKIWGSAGNADRRHLLPCKYIGSFDRGTAAVHPDLSARLKGRKAHQDLTKMMNHVISLLHRLTYKNWP